MLCNVQVVGTAMAGTCLLAPASAAALMPAAVAAAVMSPPAAVGSTAAGVFLSSLLQSHIQVRRLLRVGSDRFEILVIAMTVTLLKY